MMLRKVVWNWRVLLEVCNYNCVLNNGRQAGIRDVFETAGSVVLSNCSGSKSKWGEGALFMFASDRTGSRITTGLNRSNVESEATSYSIRAGIQQGIIQGQ
jgi:hypothetical protein